jgi:glycosyltransferase involved in cell wall biosynthesis
VIVPNLNEERYLPMFLNSLKHQTYKNFEAIFIDGGSTDQSQKLIKDSNVGKIVVDHTRNFGYVRTKGAKYASGEILFHTCSDVYLEPDLLKKIVEYYQTHPQCLSLSGRTYPLGTSMFAHLGYQIFDFLRFIFTVAPMPLHKYRPSGNFMTVRKDVYERVGGHPFVTVNEDGLFGQKLDAFTHEDHKRVAFSLDLYVGHHAKKFEQVGGVRAILFYFYTLGNLFPLLKPFLKHFEWRAGLVFEGKRKL